MTPFDKKMKGLVALSERVQGFLDDGYEVLFASNFNDMVCTKLRHHNGNIIFLKLDCENGTLSQCTNGKERHSEKVC